MTQAAGLGHKVVEQLQALHALKAGALRMFDALLAEVKRDHAARTLPSVDDLLENMIGAFGGHAEETREPSGVCAPASRHSARGPRGPASSA